MKRNIALVGHAHSGKTSLAESLLFFTKAIPRKGDVLQGTTTSDYDEEEQDRKISINASFLRLDYQGHQIQLIDTPGYLDFIGETVSCLRATDAAVVVIDAVEGVGIGTEEVWERLQRLNMPRLIFINKMDRPDAQLSETIAAIQEQFSKRAVVVDFAAERFIETVAETDDQLLEKYLESGSLTEDEVRTALRQAVLGARIFPIFTGSAQNDDGLEDLLAAVITYLPSPLEHAPLAVQDPDSGEAKELLPAEDGPCVGLVFKSVFDPQLGQLSLLRILRGTLQGNKDFYNASSRSKEHISTISLLQGKEQIKVTHAECGDIVALPKLKHSHVSDSLLDPSAERVTLRPIDFPVPELSASIRPHTRADEEKISEGLHRICEEDHTVRIGRDDETHEMIISGMGDLHLKVVLDRMKRRYGLDVDLGRPKVCYRETITRPARARYKHKKQSGGRGQYGDVELEVAPLAEGGEEFTFINKIFGGAIPKNYIPSVEKGVRQAVGEGALARSPIIRIQVTLLDGSYHNVDSSDMAFQIAGAQALKEAVRQAGPVLLEPVMEVAITIPDEFMGPVSGDISSRRGRILGQTARGRKEVLTAYIPQAEMFKYATDLRSMTGGRGHYTMTFAHYAPVPDKIAEQIMAEREQLAAK